MTSNKKFVKKLWRIMAITIAMLMFVPTVIGIMNSRTIDALGVAFTEGEKAIFKSDYAGKAELREAAREYNEYAAANSFVLLKNKDNALPLAKNSGVTGFGVYSNRLFIGGNGSGSQTEPGNVTASQGNPAIPGGAADNLHTALQTAGGLRVNPAMSAYYSGRSGIAPANYTEANGYVAPMAGISWNRIEEDIYAGTSAASSGFASAVPGTATVGGTSGVVVKNTWVSDYNDAAIVVISRYGTEGDEYALYNVPGHSDPLDTYYSPDDNELQLIDYCAANFDKVIVLINAGNSMDLVSLEDNPNVDAVMFIGMPGGTGANAIGKVLTGDIAPSGRTADLYAADVKKDPTWQNFAANIQSHLTVTTVAEFNTLREEWNIAHGATSAAERAYGKIAGTQTPAKSGADLVAYTMGDSWDTVTRAPLPSSSMTATQWRRTGPLVPVMCTSGNVGWRGTPNVSQYYLVRDKNGHPITPNTGGHTQNESRLGMIDYEEGIYLGYRYYETAAHQGFLKNSYEANPVTVKVGGYTVPVPFANFLPQGVTDEYYNRNNGVLYPFGYGLSYTTFDYEIIGKDSLDGKSMDPSGKIQIDIKVTNTGLVASRDVVQLYVTPPYITGQIEKAHVNLIAFEKTGVIQPNQSETVTLEFIGKHMASFDYNDANGNDFKGYELDAGTYTFSLRENSHEVIDSFDAKIAATKFPEDDVTGSTVKPLLSSGDLKWDGTRNDDDYYSMYRSKFVSADGTSQATIMSRADFAGTWPKPPTTGDLEYSDDALRIILAQSAFSSFNDLPTDPWYRGEEMFAKAGETLSNGTKATVDGPYANWTQANGTLTSTGSGQGQRLVTRNATDNFPARTPVQLWDMSGVAYDDPQWVTFLNQLTLQEMGMLLDTYGKDGQNGFINLDSIGRPVVRAEDGPSSLKMNFGSTIGTSFIVPHLIACSFDVEMAYKIGRLIAHDGLYSGTVGWWGPAAQMHRSSAGGRNFEYYSQDPLLNGFIGAGEVKGAIDMGMIVHLKHLFFNEQETDRYSLTTFGDEQTVREVYLRPFEFVFKYGKCNSSMSAYPRSGLLHPSANYRLYETILHDEWGFNGYSVTDYYNQENVSTNADMTIRCNQTPLNRWSNTFGTNIDGDWVPGMRNGRGGVVSEFGKNYSPSGYGALGNNSRLKLNQINNHHTTFGGPGPGAAAGADAQKTIGGTQQAGPSAVWSNNDTGTMYGIWDETDGRYENSKGDALVLYQDGETIDAWTQWYAIRNLTHRVLFVQVNSAAMMNGLVRNPWTGMANGTSASGATTATRSAPSGTYFKRYQFDLMDPQQTPGLQDLMNTGVNPTFHIMNMGTGLPDGLTLNPDTGMISGIPIETGSFTVYISIYSGDTWAGEGSGYTSGNNGAGGYRYAPVLFNLTITSQDLAAGLVDIINEYDTIIGDLQQKIDDLTKALNSGDLKGDPGAKWLSGTAAPATTDGKDGDMYLNAATADIYQKAGGTWILIANIKGNTGDNGKTVQIQASATHIQWRYAGDSTWTNLVALTDITGPAGNNGSEIQLQTTATHIQWKYANETTWNNLVALSTLTGTNGNDGRAVEFQTTATHIQWRYTGETTWNNLIALDTIKGNPGETGSAGLPGDDGREVEFQTTATYIQWRYTGETAWNNLVELKDITGPKGDDGASGCSSAISAGSLGVMFGVIALAGAAVIILRKKRKGKS